MERSERSVYTTLDFLTMREVNALVITPKFQRREIWKTPARSYFIDSLLKGLPVPPIFLRVTQSEDKRRTVREVIDGQQRLRAILDYTDDKYSLTKSTVPREHSGKRFSNLTNDDQDKIRKYGFICEVFQSISDAEVLEIFSRVNTYSVALNAQELRNGRYFGFFKRSAYSLAHEHLEFWRRGRIFTEGGIARMNEVELVSELMVAQLDGQQDKKTSLNRFYADYDDTFEEKTTIENQFRTTIDSLSEALSDTLADTEFRRPPLFYTLFCVVYHQLFGLPKEKLETHKKGRLTKSESNSLRDALLHLSDQVSAAKRQEEISTSDIPFVNACLRQTDNLRPRQTRFNRLYQQAF